MKLKSFTLAELIIAMILSAIIISMSYLALMLVARQISLYRKQTDEQLTFQQFKQAFENDLFYTDIVMLEDSLIICLSKSEKVSYSLKKDSIQRNSRGNTSSFPLKLNRFKTTYQSKPITNGITDEVEIYLYVNGEVLPLFYNKTYLASAYMNFETYFKTP